jgi:murein DD-endopeptidase MepM/ murein hydrolase activator NlpD
VHIPVADGSLTQRWGYTGLQSNGPYYDNRFSPARYYPSGFHTGVDLSAPRGTKVRNAEHGVVYAASWNGCDQFGSCWGYGGGYVVIVRHNSTPVYTSHAHMQRIFVQKGQPVHKGQVLGELDTMGYASGPHDHFSLWIRGLWWSVNRAYTLDPWSAFYGGLRDSPLIKPARCHVPLSVNLRARPTRRSEKVCERRKRTVLPMFKIKNGGSVPGYSSELWRLVWCGRWAWVFNPLVDVIRAAPVTDDILEDAGAIPLDELGLGTPEGGSDQELAEFAPSPELADPEGEPDGVRFRSRSIGTEFADDEDAF